MKWRLSMQRILPSLAIKQALDNGHLLDSHTTRHSSMQPPRERLSSNRSWILFSSKAVFFWIRGSVAARPVYVNHSGLLPGVLASTLLTVICRRLLSLNRTMKYSNTGFAKDQPPIVFKKKGIRYHSAAFFLLTCWYSKLSEIRPLNPTQSK